MEGLDGTSLLAGIVIGLIPALIVELSLKPRREARNVAKALRAEVALNMHLLALQASFRFKSPRSVPADFTMAHQAYDALASRLGELEGLLLTDVLLLYRRFAYLTEVRDLFSDFYDQREHAPPGSVQRAHAEKHLDTAIEAFNRNLDSTLDHINLVLPKLDRAAYFRWWRRTKTLEQRDTDTKVDAIARLRDDSLRKMRLEGGPYGERE